MSNTRLILFITALLLTACQRQAETVTPTPPESVATATILPLPSATPPATATAAAPTLPQTLPAGWTRVDPGGETRCADGSPFAFWVRPGAVNQLLVYFQGGGGCWDAYSCANPQLFYDNNIGYLDNPARRGGLFELDRPDNPFRDYYIVYIPSCTGDVYLGTQANEFTDAEGNTFTVHQKGALNAHAAMDWIFEAFSAPESIFVTGCSAGSVGSILFAPHLAERYPAARLEQFGDSLGFVFNTPGNVADGYGARAGFPDWIPAINEMDATAFTMDQYYNAVAEFYPQHRFSQYNSAFDDVQVRYHTALGRSVDSFGPYLAAALNKIQPTSDNFYTLTADDDLHCILPRPEFYTQTVDDTLVLDWVAALAHGDPVETIRCQNCPDGLTN